jgi:hypothetical protein
MSTFTYGLLNTTNLKPNIDELFILKQFQLLNIEKNVQANVFCIVSSGSS